MARVPQPNEPFEEPPVEQIPVISRMHVEAMERSDADEVWIGAGMHQCLLTTKGRRTGREHKVALPYWLDDDGHRVVVASYAGQPQHPAWYLNLADKRANPTVRVKVRDHEFEADAQILDGEEYTRTWEALVADRPYYADYQTRCQRRIPLVRLVEL